MKTNNMFHKVVILGCSLLFGLTACDPKDEGPSVDDYFLNYEIPDVEPTSNIPVGVLYYSTGSQGIDEARYDRLTGEYVADGKFPQFCPQKHHYCLYLYTTLKKCPKYKESYPFLM